MYLDKIYTLQTGVSLEISTIALQKLVENAMNRQDLLEIGNILRTTDLHAYLSVVVHNGAKDLIKRRSRWVSNKIKTDLRAGQSVSFRDFCNLFWRNLDEDDPDGDEWHRLIASDKFYSELTILLHKLRTAKRRLHQYEETVPDLSLEAA